MPNVRRNFSIYALELISSSCLLNNFPANYHSTDSKQASISTLLAGGLCPAQSHSNLTYTNAGGISEYLLSAPLVRRPGDFRQRQPPIATGVA